MASSSSTRLLTDAERVVLSVIKSKKNMGIWKADVKKEVKLSPTIVDKILNALVNSNLIKLVANIQNKSRKKDFFMAAEFEPTEEVTGGTWYHEGKLHKEFIEDFRVACFQVIKIHKVATLERIHDVLMNRNVVKCTIEQVEEILNSMVLDNVIIEVKSTGSGQYHSIPIGTVCYQTAQGVTLETDGDVKKIVTIGTKASVPCDSCPRISQCTPDGIISPLTCVYYTKWLSF